MKIPSFEWKTRAPDRYFCRRLGVAVRISKNDSGSWHVDVRRWPSPGVEIITFQQVVPNEERARAEGELQFKFALSDQRKYRRQNGQRA